MNIELFDHNRIAYESALSLLNTTGKAAVIHPTGTGKSFIAFKYCEEHPSETVCWLAPSEYIFKTQIENLKEVTNGYAPGNIKFFTYARLMNMSDEEMQSIQPDFFVIDEYHRAGAKVWQQYVEKLLDIYPSVPMLGLTATNIRYLDDQRDMADELFEGNIASHITLGDAVVRGILTPPKYVLSVFSYQQDIDRYASRVHNAKSKAVRDEGEKYLEALRRELANAIGVDEVFKKHITEKHGKYLVFCSNAEHMREMISKIPEWFHDVDPNPHVYSAYSEDPATSRAFAEFKADNSEHLKLLYCIDMLNEGIHVKDISGVILLRPTISPIIYKQQIGRALAAGSKNNAIIFDIVMNIENLYSIGSIKEEMHAAITYYQYLGDYKNIVNEDFHIIDEVQECRKLFDKLEETLNASWDLMYAEAKKYYEDNGHLMVPARYKTETGLSLGSWLVTQRNAYKGKSASHLTEHQIRLLEEIGILWDDYRELSWDQNYQEAKDYYETFGDLLVPNKYVTRTGFPLGSWITVMRSAQANHRSSVATPERIAKLNEIGMVWSVISDQWEKNFAEAKAYYEKNGDLLVPPGYVTESGLKLANWISHLRQTKKGKGRGRLTENQIERLNAIGMAWDAEGERWQIGYREAEKYYLTHGHLKVPMGTIVESGYNLGLWIQLKRRQYKQGRLAQQQIDSLNAIGMWWGRGNSSTAP